MWGDIVAEIGLKKVQNPISVDIGDATFCIRITDSGNRTFGVQASSIHLHSGFEVQWVKSGTVTIFTEDSECTAKTGDIVVIPQGAYHRNDTPSTDFCRFTCEFSILPNSSAVSFREYLKYNRILSYVKDVILLPNSKGVLALNMLENVQNLNSAEVFNRNKAVLSIFLIDLFGEISGQILSAETQTELHEMKGDTLVSERQKFIITNCLAENYSTDFTSLEIEKRLNMSKRNAARIVYNHFGKTVSELVLEHRMKAATAWIKNSDEPLSTIAEMTGYKTYVAFFTAFKKYHGISPAEYREK